MSGKLPESLVLEARRAFVEYEKVYVTRVAKMPGGRMSAEPVEAILATGDQQKVRDYIEDLERGRQELLNATIV